MGKLSLNPLNKLSFLFYYIYIISYILIFVKLYTFQFLLIECPKAIIVRNLAENVRDLMRIIELFIKFQKTQTHARFYAIFWKVYLHASFPSTPAHFKK